MPKPKKRYSSKPGAVLYGRTQVGGNEVILLKSKSQVELRRAIHRAINIYTMRIGEIRQTRPRPWTDRDNFNCWALSVNDCSEAERLSLMEMIETLCSTWKHVPDIQNNPVREQHWSKKKEKKEWDATEVTPLKHEWG